MKTEDVVSNMFVLSLSQFSFVPIKLSSVKVIIRLGKCGSCKMLFNFAIKNEQGNFCIRALNAKLKQDCLPFLVKRTY